MPPGVQHPTGQRAHPVEEDLRDEEEREDHRQVVLGAGEGVCVQVHQQGRGQGGDQGEGGQRDRGQGEHPLVVGLAAVGVPLGGVDEQRYHDAGQDAAEHQVIHRVGQGVRVVVRGGDRADAEHVGDDQGAEEPGATGREGAQCHDAAGADDVDVLDVRP
jgi:hypothetical protein